MPAPEKTSRIARLATTAARRWKVTFTIWLVVLGLGVYAYVSGLAREGFPPINVPFVVVDGTFFADDTATVDGDVAQPLIEAYRGLPDVEEIQSFSLPSSFAVVVEFDSGDSSAELAELVSAATPDLVVPADLTVRSIDATKFVDQYDVLVSVNSPSGASPADLQAEAVGVAAQLLATDVISEAEVQDLLTEGVDPATGETATRQTGFSRVAFGGDEAFRDSIAIGLVRNPTLDLDVLEFSDAVEDALSGVTLGDGYEAAVTADFANNIRSQLSSLIRSLLTGLVAVAIVSYLLIGWRVSVITGVFMGSVMFTALLSLWLVGYSLNTITLFGLILTLGLLVDDAIVVSESIDANRDEPDPAVGEAEGPELGVITTSIQRVGGASLSGTLTTVLVFAPMLFVGGVLGKFIRAIPTTVIITLLLSFLLSMTVIPAVARHFLLSRPADRSPLGSLQRRMAKGLGRLAAYPSRNGVRGVVAGLGLIVVAVVTVVASFGVAAGLGFNIFPEAKDTNGVSVSVDFDADVTIEEAQALTRRVDEAVLDVLGDDLVLAQYIGGDERGMSIFIDLVSFADRSTRSPTYVDRLEEVIGDIDRGRLSAAVIGQGPPTEDYPFAVQIDVDDATVAQASRLADDIRVALVGESLDKATGADTVITDALISTDGQIYRSDGQRQLEVRASFDTDDLTSNLNAAEDLVNDLFGADELAARGLDPEALSFDFGQESDNQDDFASLGVALLGALVLMVALLVFQFRSIVQPLLILLAIPFSFLGVFSLLSLTDNALSFFVMVGFIALIGVVVNNTILLVDAANQARRAGETSKEAIRYAVERRFRPLVATTITTVAGLLPLALSDPFWESLSFTLIGGLVSSTIMVLVVFPVFYLMVEAVRTPLRNRWRARQGRELLS